LPGFHGKYCNKTCPEGHYGRLCYNVCDCDSGTEYCHHVCGCIPGNSTTDHNSVDPVHTHCLISSETTNGLDTTKRGMYVHV
jgi:hypothetical protein